MRGKVINFVSILLVFNKNTVEIVDNIKKKNRWKKKYPFGRRYKNKFKSF